MKKSTRTSHRLLLAVAFLASLVGVQQAANAQHPAAGTWDFTVDMVQGPETGNFTIIEAEEALSGTINLEGQPGAIPLENVMIDGSKLSFDFNSGRYGVMNVNAPIEGDAFTGIWTVTSMGMEMPIAGTRQKK